MHKRLRGSVRTLIGLFAFTLLAGVQTVSAAHVVPVQQSGNPACGAGLYEYKVEPVASGVYDDPASSFEVTLTVSDTASGPVFNWTANMGVDSVIAKGGPNANVYNYNPEVSSDTGLHAPVNASNGKYYGLSHISFCFDFDLVIEKTADTAFTRSYAWDIDKTGTTGPIVVDQGEDVMVDYEATVTATSTDSNHMVTGTISIMNPAPVATTVTSVTDTITGVGAVTVVCPQAVPFPIAAGATVECTYSQAVPNADARTNTVTVIASPVVGGTATAAVDFATTDVTYVDRCVTLEDTMVADAFDGVTPLCAPEAGGSFEKVVEYSHTYTGLTEACNDFNITNIARVRRAVAGTILASDDHTVPVEVECILPPPEDGCTLTQGYWKNHADAWPVTSLTMGGVTYNQTQLLAILKQPVKGNGYIILAHQLIATLLNIENGADATAVSSTIASANTLLNGKNLATNPQPKVKPNVTSGVAGQLDAYNNGHIGPGHCEE